MEDQYNNNNPHSDSYRGNNFLYTSVPILATNSSSPQGNFVIRPSNNCSNGGSSSTSLFNHMASAAAVNHLPSDIAFPPSDIHELRHVKLEHHQPRQQVHDYFHYQLMREFQISNGGISSDVDDLKAKLISHSRFPNLLQAFLDCQKVGAPPEVAAKLGSVREEFEEGRRSSMATTGSSSDPELDHFMEVYYEMLVKYREELTKPIEEAADFMKRIESQLNTLCNGSFQILQSGKKEQL